VLLIAQQREEKLMADIRVMARQLAAAEAAAAASSHLDGELSQDDVSRLLGTARSSSVRSSAR